jgi:hypothetical protein
MINQIRPVKEGGSNIHVPVTHHVYVENGPKRLVTTNTDPDYHHCRQSPTRIKHEPVCRYLVPHHLDSQSDSAATHGLRDANPARPGGRKHPGSDEAAFCAPGESHRFLFSVLPANFYRTFFSKRNGAPRRKQRPFPLAATSTNSFTSGTTSPHARTPTSSTGKSMP